MDIVLIAGLWLQSSIWSEVSTELESLGHRPLPLALPGVDDGSRSATLDQQVATVVEAVDNADRPIVVGHSAACTLAWLAADRRPESIQRVLLIGGFPAAQGEAYADIFPFVDGVMPFPGWQPFEGPDAADLDQVARDRVSDSAVPVPEGVSRGVVHLSDDRRFEVPVMLVCPEFGPDQARAWIDAGDVPELARVEHLEFVDIDSGHWPMVSKPSELARVIDAAIIEG